MVTLAVWISSASLAALAGRHEACEVETMTCAGVINLK